MSSFSEKAFIFQVSICFDGLSRDIILEMAGKSRALCFPKGETIFGAHDAKISFYLVASGLVRVSICRMQRILQITPKNSKNAH